MDLIPYSSALPMCFLYQITLSKREVTQLVPILIEKEVSFALTQDKPHTLWLSETAHHTLLEELKIGEAK